MAAKSTSAGWNNTPVFTPLETASVDIKVDGEANANSGVFQSAWDNDVDCHSFGEYSLVNDTRECIVMFVFR